MEKYLFTDGTNVLREVETNEELQTLIQSSADPAKIRIWIFNTNEWISLADFNKRSAKSFSPVKKTTPAPATVVTEVPAPVRRSYLPDLLKKVAAVIMAVAIILLVYNFTRVTWSKAAPVTVMAARPANTPPVNMDSLAATIEALRGLKLDKITRTNLRIRNTWPDLLQLQVTADRDTSREGSRYYNIELAVDNSTGYAIDNAVAEFIIWKNAEASRRDTLRFMNIGYAAPAKRRIEGTFKGDSVSVSFNSIRARSFNFCYSSEKKSNYGNYNDRWFCK